MVEGRTEVDNAAKQASHVAKKSVYVVPATSMEISIYGKKTETTKRQGAATYRWPIGPLSSLHEFNSATKLKTVFV